MMLVILIVLAICAIGNSKRTTEESSTYYPSLNVAPYTCNIIKKGFKENKSYAKGDMIFFRATVFFSTKNNNKGKYPNHADGSVWSRLFEQYDKKTKYKVGDTALDGKLVYFSLKNNNKGKPLTNGAFWKNARDDVWAGPNYTVLDMCFGTPPEPTSHPTTGTPISPTKAPTEAPTTEEPTETPTLSAMGGP